MSLVKQYFFVKLEVLLNFVQLRVYSAANVKEELEVAKKDYLQANVVVKRSKKVFLPRILERYSKETSISSDDLLSWVCENVDKKLRDAIQKCIDSKSNRKSSHIMEWSPYDTRFRYVFPRDLTEKPWWVWVSLLDYRTQCPDQPNRLWYFRLICFHQNTTLCTKRITLNWNIREFFIVLIVQIPLFAQRESNWSWKIKKKISMVIVQSPFMLCSTSSLVLSLLTLMHVPNWIYVLERTFHVYSVVSHLYSS